MAQVLIRALSKSFGSVDVLKDVSLDVGDGSFVVLVGPSGCGKSTLLRSIAGLEPVTRGSIDIGGRNVESLPPAQRDIAMVFQSYALYPHMNVRGNMSFGLRFGKTPKNEIERRVDEASRMLQLDSLMQRYPRELSGGQRQRVAIGRAIVRQPKVFLFDEPLSNLDAALRINTRVEIARLHKLLKTTMIYVTHDQVEAMTLAEQIVVMNQGRIEQAGKPLDLYYRPANLFVAAFIGSPAMNIVDGAIAGQPGSHKIGFRPEHARLAKSGLLQGTLDLVERLGETGYAYLRHPSGQQLIVEVRGEPEFDLGSTVGITVEPQHLHRFAANGSRL